MHYLAFDTGVTTGFSWIKVTDTELKIVHTDQFESLEAFYTFLNEPSWNNDLQIIGRENVEVIYESFTLRRGGAFTPDQLAPTYGIGALESFAQRHGLTVHKYTPSQNKSACTDRMLNYLGLEGPKGHVNRHQRDASRLTVGHLLKIRHRTVIQQLRGWNVS